MATTTPPISDRPFFQLLFEHLQPYCTDCVQALQWFIDHPEVTWSGIGIVFLGCLGAVFKTSFRTLFRKGIKRETSFSSRNLTDFPSRLRRQLLIRLRNDLNKRLDSFFHQRPPLNLDKKLAPEYVHHSHSVQEVLEYSLETGGIQTPIIKKSITDIFKRADIHQRLAILGKPGSGKTSSLLELVDHLLTSAEKEGNAPLPIVFECSEWNGNDLIPWMAHSLYHKYEIKEREALKLIRDRAIFPLFDGLDELMASRQKAFVNSFNQFQKDRSTVLCCRLKEYRNLQEKLELNNAVILQDISIDKLEIYLGRLNLDELWHCLQQSGSKGDVLSCTPAAQDVEPETLMELAQRPLFLGMMIDLNKQLIQSPDLQIAGEAEQFLWNLYINYWLKETPPNRIDSISAPGKSYSIKQSRRWLRSLARQMARERIIELRIDQLQPSWLSHYWKFGMIYGLVICRYHSFSR